MENKTSIVFLKKRTGLRWPTTKHSPSSIRLMQITSPAPLWEFSPNALKYRSSSIFNPVIHTQLLLWSSRPQFFLANLPTKQNINQCVRHISTLCLPIVFMIAEIIIVKKLFHDIRKPYIKVCCTWPTSRQSGCGHGCGLVLSNHCGTRHVLLPGFSPVLHLFCFL